MNATAEIAEIRRRAVFLVDREYSHWGSLMASYQAVAQAVGTSPSWLRKFVKGYDEAKEPGFVVGLNIRAHYDAICGRIEANNEARRARLEILEARNAVVKGPDRMVAPVAPGTSCDASLTDNLEIPDFLRR